MAAKSVFAKIGAMNKRSLLIMAVGSILLICAVYYGWQYATAYFDRDRVFASGTIEAVETDVATKVPGRVLSFLADEGDTIQKGTIIASLETSQLYAGFKQSVAAEKSAQIRFENAKRNYIRAKSLIRKKMMSEQDYDAVKSKYEAAESDMNGASAARAVAEISLNEANIKAPISGTILTKVVEIGDLLSPYSTLVTMADLSHLQMMLYVSEMKYGRIGLGDTVDVSVDSFLHESFSGKVIYISDQAEFTPKNIQTKEERVSQVFGVKIDIPNPEMKLKPGMPADAVIYLSK
jgi:HlyD family secretion protein